MTIDRINFQKLFPIGIYQNVRIGVEVQISGEESPTEALTAAKDMVEKWFKETYPHVGEVVTYADPEVSAIPVKKDSKEAAEQRVVDAIKSCVSVKGVEAFGLLARNNPFIRSAYENKLKEFK